MGRGGYKLASRLANSILVTNSCNNLNFFFSELFNSLIFCFSSKSFINEFLLFLGNSNNFCFSSNSCNILNLFFSELFNSLFFCFSFNSFINEFLLFIGNSFSSSNNF